MNATTVRAQRVMVLATLALGVFTASSSAQACVVGTGGGTCDETALNACLPGGGSFDGTVTFNCGAAPTTITVTSTKTISADTTIDGGGVITVQNSGSTTFSVNSGVAFTVENLTLSGSGDGIDSSGTATVTAINCTFTGNGNGIFKSGTGGAVTATGCTFTGNGNGISDSGTATATNCTFTGNGNGISAPTAIVTNCTFTGNSNGISAGTATATNCTFTENDNGISAGTATATNCTFVNNVDGLYASGAVTATNCTFIVNDYGILGDSATVTNCTFANLNSYGIDVTSATVTNTILADNATNCSGTITDGGHNIDDGTSCGFTGTGCTTTTGTSFCNTDPKLASGLANNGGPTQTIALLANSPAINAGNEAVCAAPPVNNLDQRGFVRPGFPATSCSIGAFEFDALPPQAIHQAPALSASWLFSLAALLGASGLVMVRRGASSR